MSLRIYRREKQWQGDRVIECRAVHVYDGDGFLAAGYGANFMLRLWGIDAPEWGQDSFLESRNALHALVSGRPLWSTVICVDWYGRRVCRVRTAAGIDVGLAMVRSGWAWWYRSFASHDPELKGAETEARAGLSGLWASAGAERPWSYRRRSVRIISHPR